MFFFSHLTTIVELEDEVQDAVGQTCAESMLQIYFVSLDHLIGMLGSPPCLDPDQVILNHGDCSVCYCLLLWRQTCVQIFLETFAQFLDNECGISDFLAIELNEWQLTFLGTEFRLVINILRKTEKNKRIFIKNLV